MGLGARVHGSTPVRSLNQTANGWRLETANDVAERIRLCLDHVPAERLWLTADCGFSALPRYLAHEKMRALVAGARIVRNSL